jgi:hypothetical protein
MSLRLICSALLQPLLCKTRFFAYSACSLTHQNCWELTDEFDASRVLVDTASVAPRLYSCTTLYTKIAAFAHCLYFCFPFMFFFSLQQNSAMIPACRSRSWTRTRGWAKLRWFVQTWLIVWMEWVKGREVTACYGKLLILIERWLRWDEWWASEICIIDCSVLPIKASKKRCGPWVFISSEFWGHRSWWVTWYCNWSPYSIFDFDISRQYCYLDHHDADGVADWFELSATTATILTQPHLFDFEFCHFIASGPEMTLLKILVFQSSTSCYLKI